MRNILAFLLSVLCIAGCAEGSIDSFARQIDLAARRAETERNRKTAPGESDPKSHARRIMIPNAVYPLIHSRAIRMTGKLEDWKDIPFEDSVCFRCDTNGLPLPKDLKVRFKAAVSDHALYILAVAEDRKLHFGSKGPFYLSDCFEVFLDPFFKRAEECDDSTAQIFITAADQTGKKLKTQGKLSVKAIPVEVPNGWGAEIEIPLDNDLFKASVYNGFAFGFNLCYNNNDSGKGLEHKLSWSGLDRADESWQKPAVYGVFVTVSPERKAAGPVREGRLITENRKARESGETLSDISILAKNRPSPAIVRGFMMGGFPAAKVRSWGANAVRLQYYPLRQYKKEWKKHFPEFLDQMEKHMKLARANDLKVIIDLHDTPFLGKGSPWKDPELERNFIWIWRRIAERMKPYKDVIWGYDIYNEPVDQTQLPYAPREWRSIAVKIIKAIREIDPDTWIIYEVGPGGGSRGFEGLKPLPDAKVIYSCHFYTPGAFTHQGIAAANLQDPALMAKAQKNTDVRYPGLIGGIYWDRARLEKSLGHVIRFQQKYKVPIYIGEFSVIVWAHKGSALQYLRDVIDIFEKYGWSWTYHAFAEYPGWSPEYEEGVMRPDGRLKKDPNSARGVLLKEYLKRNKTEE